MYKLSEAISGLQKKKGEEKEENSVYMNLHVSMSARIRVRVWERQRNFQHSPIGPAFVYREKSISRSEIDSFVLIE